MESAVVVFTLSMPNTNSWNGRWSGEGTLYAVVRNFGRTKSSHEKADDVCKKQSYYYNFGDGWGASVKVEKMTIKDANKIKKKSAGFCGYNWMIESIIKHGKIITD